MSVILTTILLDAVAVMMTANTPPTTLIHAFERLSQSVDPSDRVDFQSTTLQDVRQAAQDIENIQRERRSAQNLRRIEPFLGAIEKYSKSIEIICNGTPYLPWIWVCDIPILLIIRSDRAVVVPRLQLNSCYM